MKLNIQQIQKSCCFELENNFFFKKKRNTESDTNKYQNHVALNWKRNLLKKKKKTVLRTQKPFFF